MLEFYTGMIVSFNSFSFPQYSLTFGRSPKTPKLNSLYKPLSDDVVDIFAKQQEMLPIKMVFTEIEEVFNEILIKRDRIINEIYTEKQNLRYFYTAHDNYDYHQLLKQRRNLDAKLNRIAKKVGMNTLHLEDDIYTKRSYNRYAPKVYRASTIEELNQLQDTILSMGLHTRVEELLTKLIEQRRILLQ